MKISKVINDKTSDSFVYSLSYAISCNSVKESAYTWLRYDSNNNRIEDSKVVTSYEAKSYTVDYAFSGKYTINLSYSNEGTVKAIRFTIRTYDPLELELIFKTNRSDYIDKLLEILSRVPKSP